MAVKGLILFYFRLTPHKSYLELQLQLPGSEPVEQQPTEGLGLGSVIHSLRRPGFTGLNLITRPVCMVKINNQKLLMNFSVNMHAFRNDSRLRAIILCIWLYFSSVLETLKQTQDLQTSLHVSFIIHVTVQKLYIAL